MYRIGELAVNEQGMVIDAHNAYYPFIPVHRGRLSSHAQLQILRRIHLLPETKYVEDEALLLVPVRRAS